jgi:uncharacterized protein
VSQLVPFTTFVTKVVSRCNLNCSYCYMYNLQDGTWRNQPAVMRPEIVRDFARRIAVHAKRHGLPAVHIILHGGEPLMMGLRAFGHFVDTCRNTLLPDCRPIFSMQSNGTLVSGDWIEALADKGVRIGVSVDGPRDAHDRFRVDHFGRGSFDRVVEGIRLLKEHPRGPQVFSDVMAVVDVTVDPADMFAFWQDLDVAGFDLSLPHANHASLPPNWSGEGRYGDWLIAFFDLWFGWNRADRCVRYFDNIIRMLFGYPLSTDNIGGKPVGVVVVETDGGIEPTDAFKCCEDGITKLGLNVRSNDFDDLYAFPMVNVLQNGAYSLCDACQACDAQHICGGGYMPHRYAAETGFDNPSVYCEDLYRLVHHVAKRVETSLPKDMLDRIRGLERVAA